MGSCVESGGARVPERPWLWELVTRGTEARAARWDHPAGHPSLSLRLQPRLSLQACSLPVSGISVLLTWARDKAAQEQQY